MEEKMKLILSMLVLSLGLVFTGCSDYSYNGHGNSNVNSNMNSSVNSNANVVSNINSNVEVNSNINGTK